MASVIGLQEMRLLQDSLSWPSMTSLHWMGMSLDAPVWLSMDQKGPIFTAVNTGSAGEYGRCHTFFNNGFQEWVLAGLDGT